MKRASAVILVGGSGPSMLRSRVGLPICLLPLPDASSLLAAWIDRLRGFDWITDVSVVTGRPEDLPAIRSELETIPEFLSMPIEVIADRNEHRGTAGTLRDTVLDREGSKTLLVVEGTTIPPAHLPSIDLAPLDVEDVAGMILRTPQFEPAGLMALERAALAKVPEVGFFDLKEQLLPRLIENGSRIRVEEVPIGHTRVAGTDDYLDHVAAPSKRDGDEGRTGARIHPTAQIDPSAIVTTSVLLAPGVQVGPGAVVDRSVLLEGCQIGAGAVITGSVIRPGMQVRQGARIDECEERDSLPRRNGGPRSDTSRRRFGGARGRSAR